MNPTKYKSIGCPEPEGGTPRSTKEIRRIRRAVKVWIAKAKGKFKWYSGKDVIVKIGRSQNYLGAIKRIKSWDRLMGVDKIVRMVKTRVPIILAERTAKYDAISLCGFGYNSKGEQIVLMDGVSKWIAVTSDILPEFFEMPTEITSDFANTYINGVDIKIKSRLLSK